MDLLWLDVWTVVNVDAIRVSPGFAPLQFQVLTVLVVVGFSIWCFIGRIRCKWLLFITTMRHNICSAHTLRLAYSIIQSDHVDLLRRRFFHSRFNTLTIWLLLICRFNILKKVIQFLCGLELLLNSLLHAILQKNVFGFFFVSLLIWWIFGAFAFPWMAINDFNWTKNKTYKSS